MKDTDEITKARNKKASEYAKEDEEAVDNAIGSLLEHRQGRKFLWWLLELGNLGGNPFTANALSTSFACGELNVGQRILDRIIQVNPAGYARMVQENADEQRTRDESIERAGDAVDGDGED